jgi:hypothetical protein
MFIITKPKDSSPCSQKHVYCDQFNTVQDSFTEEEGIEKMYVQSNIAAHSNLRMLDISQIVKMFVAVVSVSAVNIEASNFNGALY